jgi:gentisate 1,2-dioxygenase
MDIADLDALRRVDTLDLLYAAAEQQDLSPAWIPRAQPIMWKQPQSRFVPGLWRFAAARATLEAAGRLIGVEQADRRNFALRNPAPGTNFETTRTQVAAYQMIKPGEYAPPHRHAPHALRMILDGEGLYSVVDGVRMPMRPGDVVLTPGGSWHGHGHEGDEAAYWLDVLDVPFCHLTEAMFFQTHPSGDDPVRERTEVHPYRFAAAAMARELDATAPDPDRRHGPRITLPTPDMPSFELTVERLSAGQGTAPWRDTANRVFAVMFGEGESALGDGRFAWRRGDVFCAPCWTRFSHRASADAQIFTVSDAPVLRFARYLYAEADLTG